MGLFKCLNFQSFPLYLSKRKASVHFHEQMPCLKAVFLQPLCMCNRVGASCLIIYYLRRIPGVLLYLRQTEESCQAHNRQEFLRYQL